MTTYETSAREAMLEALKTVLSGIDGVKFVSRQAITSEMVSEAQMPAILIDETLSRYSWISRAGQRTMNVGCVLGLEVQVRTIRARGNEVNESTVRELLVNEVLQTLIHNSRLICQLPGEDEDTAHARDVGEQFSVRYVPGNGNTARALITITAEFTAVFDRRTKIEWQQLFLELAAEGAEEVPDNIEIDITTS